MAIQNQGYRRDLNLGETTNETQTLSNLAGAGIANDLRVIQNNLRNYSTLSYDSYESGFFTFPNREFVFTNDDVVTLDKNVNIGGATLFADTRYFVCNSDGVSKFRLSTTPSTSPGGILPFNVNSVFFDGDGFEFRRDESVNRDNLENFIEPRSLDGGFSFLEYQSINSALSSIQTSKETVDYYIPKKYRKSSNTITSDSLSIEGSVITKDPTSFNINTSSLSDSNSPGIFISGTRAFSTDNNPWTKVSDTLQTDSTEIAVGELHFSGDVEIEGISINSESSNPLNFTHKIPAIINGETYFLLLKQ